MKMSYFEENIANNKQVDEATKRYSLSSQSSELGRKIKEAKTYAECFVLSRKIKDLKEKYGEYADYTMNSLREELETKVQELADKTIADRAELENERQKLLAENSLTHDSIETSKQLDVESDSILLGIVLQLGNNNIKNQRLISEKMKMAQTNRNIAYALTKLTVHEKYGKLITTQMKQELADLIKSPAQKAMIKLNQPRLDEIAKEETKLFLEAMKLNRLHEQFKGTENGAYFKNGKREYTKRKPVLHSQYVPSNDVEEN